MWMVFERKKFNKISFKIRCCISFIKFLTVKHARSPKEGPKIFSIFSIVWLASSCWHRRGEDAGLCGSGLLRGCLPLPEQWYTHKNITGMRLCEVGKMGGTVFVEECDDGGMRKERPWFGGVSLMRMGCVRMELLMWMVRRSVEEDVEGRECM